VRVHEHILERQKLPPPLVSKRIWDERLFDIAHFEDYLTRQGTIILKSFLHLSRKEQKKRFMERLERPDKHWKFSPSDVHERKFSRKQFGLPRRNVHRGMWCRLTTNGLPGSPLQQLLWMRWRNSTSPTQPSTRRKSRNCKPRERRLVEKSRSEHLVTPRQSFHSWHVTRGAPQRILSAPKTNITSLLPP
jgi:hypothetical protein